MATEKKSYNRGLANGRTKLTPRNVLKIYRLYHLGWTAEFLAENYGVSKQTIHNIVSKRSWRSLLAPEDALKKPYKEPEQLELFGKEDPEVWRIFD